MFLDHLMELVILLPLVTLVFLISFSPKRHLPPGPVALPIIGHFHLLGPLIHRSFTRLSVRYGPILHLRLGSVPCVVVSTPELARELLRSNPYELNFAHRMRSTAIDLLTYSSSFAFAPYGPYWQFVKKFITTDLLSARTLHCFLPVRTRELRRFLRLLRDRARSREPTNVTQELAKLTNNIISLMMLGGIRDEGGAADDEVHGLIRDVTQIFGEFDVSDFLWLFRNVDIKGYKARAMSVHRKYDELLEKTIGDREMMRKRVKLNGAEDGRKVKDFLDMMLDLLETENLEIQFTRNHIKALVLDLFTAATDTTAICLEWALAELMNHPEVLRKAQAEIDEIVGADRLVEESDCPQLRYIQAIIKETLRLHPPVPMIARKSKQGCKIREYTIPPETLLFVNIWSIGRDPRYWTEPLDFRPERFMVDGGTIDVKGQHFKLLPFGTGRRACPGMPLAMQELPVTLAAMVQCFDWEVVGPRRKGRHPVDMTERPGLTAPRAHDLVCLPVPRIALDMLGP